MVGGSAGLSNDDADYFRGGPVLLYASLIMDCFSLVVSSWSFSQLHFDDLQACCMLPNFFRFYFSAFCFR